MGKKVLSALLALTLLLSPVSLVDVNVNANGSDLKLTNDEQIYQSNLGEIEVYDSENFKGQGTEQETIFEYLDQQKEKFGFSGKAQENFKIVDQFQDDVLGDTIIRLQQTYNGYPVYGAIQVSHIGKNGDIQNFSGNIVPKLSEEKKLISKVTLSASEAVEIAKNDLNLKNVNYVKQPSAELNVYNLNSESYLTYVVELNYVGEKTGRWVYFVDALNKKILDKYDNLQAEGKITYGKGKGVLGDTKSLVTYYDNNLYFLSDKKRGQGISTYDSQNEVENRGELWEDEDNLLMDEYDGPAVDAHYYLARTYDFYKSKFNRNSFDGKGAQIISSVHYGTKYNNAFWNGEQVAFGDGDGKQFIPLSGSIDVVAHELTHAVTEYSAGLVYRNESGAINEAISDIFGTLVEFNENRNPDWLLGEDVYTPGKNGDALRSMKDPTQYGDPDHYADRYIGEEDNGGVHINSGIINKAAYLISEGGTHHNIKVNGIGKEKLGKIFYRALTQYLTKTSNFMQMRVAAIQSAKDLYGQKSNEAVQVANAFSAVGIEGPKNLINISVGKKYTGTIKQEGEVKWFVINPKDIVSKQSHIKFEVSNIDALISIYPSLKSAENGETSVRYQNRSEAVDFPVAWEGPYYIRIEARETGEFTFNNTPITKEPQEHQDECITEVAGKYNKPLFNQLTSYRNVRDNLLRQSKSGKEFISLYYQISQEIIDDYLINKQFRDSINNDFNHLISLNEGLGKMAIGSGTQYKISQEDNKTIQHLKASVESKLSNRTKQNLNQLWEKFNLNNLEGKKLSDVFSQIGISTKDASQEEIIIKLKKGTSVESTLHLIKQKADTSVTTISPLSTGSLKIEGTYVVGLKNGSDVEKIISNLKSLPQVEYVEKNGVIKATSYDIQYPYHWSLENTGQNGGTNGDDIHFKAMENILRGVVLNKVKVAVLDTGIGYELADFKGVVDTNKDYDFINNDNDAVDDDYHGTHVSGIISAIRDNQYSMTGINNFTQLLPIKVLNEDGEGNYDQLALGIKYAVENGAKVINMSLGGSESSQLIEDQLKIAYDKGVTIIASAGNNGSDGLGYPASSEYVISVGATDSSDALADFSSYGEGLDLVAPGVLIPSLTPYGEVEYASGTSMAAPHVTAMAALAYSMKSGITPSQVLEIFQNNSDDLGETGFDNMFGWGRLNAEKVVRVLNGTQLQLQKPTVNDIGDIDEVVTGKTQPGVNVIVKKGTFVLGQSNADIKGVFKVKIAKQKIGTELTIHVENSVGLKSPEVKKVVVDKTPPLAPTVNPITDKDRKVTGKAEPLSSIVIKVGSTVIGKGNTYSTGGFSVPIKAQKGGTVLTVTSIDKNENISKVTMVVVQDKTAPSAPVVNPVGDYNRKVSGKAEPLSLIEIKVGSTLIGKGNTSSKGTFSVPIKAQKAGTVLTVTAKDKYKNTSTATSIVVQDKTAPTTPIVNSISNKDTRLTGKAEPYSLITVKYGTKIIGNGQTGKDGKFSIPIRVQKAGVVLSVTATDKYKNISAIKKVTVQDKVAPSVPTVYTVKNRDTKITGKAEANSKVIAKIGSRIIGTTKADKYGRYTIRIASQRTGTPIYVYAEDNAKNTSMATRVIVKR